MKKPDFKIRPYSSEDIDAIVKHANDYDVARYLTHEFPFPYTSNDARFWVNHSLGFYPYRNMAIEVDGEAAGDIGLTLREGIYRSSGEFGYWLGKQHWGKGIMTSVVKKWIAYSFETFSIHKLYARVSEHNPASVRVLEKAGMQYEATLKKHIITEGKQRDVHYFSLFRN